MKDKIESYCPANPKDWRKWLDKNHKEKDAVWLIFFKKTSVKSNLTWSEAVDEALCYGWIDSTKKSIDSEKYKQYFSKRKPNSTWSKINKEKIEKLIKSGLMANAGLKTIEVSKRNGTWSLMDNVEKLIIPEDLEQQFDKRPGSKDYFLSLSKSARKSMLHWIVIAKRLETRQKRIIEVAEQASQKQKPKQFR